MLALIAVAAWNIAGWRSETAAEERVRSLRTKVEKAKLGSDTMDDAGSVVSKSRPKGGGKSAPVDWKDLSEKLLEAQAGGGAGDLRALADLEGRISDMSKEELAAAMDEILGMDLSEEARTALEEMLLEPLIAKDPELALTKFAHHVGNDDSGLGWQLASALGAWAKTDAGAARAWLDRQIADGRLESKSLDGQSQARIEFEGALVASLLGVDPAAAGQRIAALPEEQRREALEQIPFSELSPAEQRAYAELVRGLVPQDERAGSFTHAISQLVPEGGLEQVDAFLDGIQATPDERAVSAREAASSYFENIAADRAVTREDVEALRKWLDKQAPGTKDRVTGESLGDAAQEDGEFSFADASKLALEYHRKSGNDEVLVAFLESFAARSNLEKAISLADKINDRELRKQVLDRLN